MIFSISIAFIIIVVVSTAGYQHYIISKQPDYNPETTLLNYEIVGSGENKLVLLNGLTGSLKYWKRNLDNITITHRLLLVDFVWQTIQNFSNSEKYLQKVVSNEY